MRKIFESEGYEAVILIDASNAFNSLNRQVTLHNIQYIFPQFATILINTYRYPARLIINERKKWIILKNDILEKEAKTVFVNSSVKCTTSGKRHLGASIGSKEFRKDYATEKINDCCDEMKKLTEIVLVEPQAAFEAFTHGELHKFRYFLRTFSGMEEYLQPLDSVITDLFIPSLLGAAITENERHIFQQSIKDGDLAFQF